MSLLFKGRGAADFFALRMSLVVNFLWWTSVGCMASTLVWNTLDSSGIAHSYFVWVKTD